MSGRGGRGRSARKGGGDAARGGRAAANPPPIVIESVGDDRALWEGEVTTPRAFKLIQGYLWHPRSGAYDMAALLPRTLGPDVHLLLDALPRAPFSFFDDGTPSATQVVYQLTVVTIVQPGEDPAAHLRAAVARLEESLNATPPGVGWQLMSDLREVD